MPHISKLVDIEVHDRGIVQGKRTLTINIEAQPNLFELSDMLSRESAVKSFETVIKTANKSAVSEYAESGRKLLKELGKGRGRKR